MEIDTAISMAAAGLPHEIQASISAGIQVGMVIAKEQPELADKVLDDYARLIPESVPVARHLADALILMLTSKPHIVVPGGPDGQTD